MFSRYLSIVLISLSSIVSAWGYAEEKLFFLLDGRSWKIGFENFSEDKSIVEMVLEDENIAAWSELFTIQTFQGLDISAKEFASSIEKTFKENVLSKVNQRMHFKWIESDSFNIIENSFISQDTKEQESEYNIGRVLKGKDVIYYLRYSAKDKNTFEQGQDKWIQRLKDAYVGESLKAEQKGYWFTLTKNEIREGRNTLSYQPEIATIEDKAAGFSLNLPTDWLINKEWVKNKDSDSEHPETIALIFLKPDQTIYGGVAFLDDGNQETDPRKRFFETYKKQGVKVTLLKKGKIETERGDKGLFLLLGENDEIGWVNFFKKDNRIFRLEVWGPKKQFKELKEHFDKIIFSFTFLKSVSSSAP